MTGEHRVDVFFYGSYINFDVLVEAGIGPRHYELARLPGYRLVIGPRANLVEDDAAQAYGIVTALSHRELHGLYTGHALGRLGELYQPEAVLTFTYDNTMVPALCYLCHDMRCADPDPAYVDRIRNAAEKYGFPADYLADIEAFKPVTA